MFCRKQMDETLTQFDDRALLNDLVSARIFVRIANLIAFEYQFFYIFCLGRHVATHPKILHDFITRNLYLNHYGLTEVISELSTDNEVLVFDVVTKLEQALEEFGSKYLPEDFDPFARLEWLNDPEEHKNLWEPLNEMVSKGPRNPTELDEIKRSIVDERRSTNQTITVQKFDQLERRLLRLQYSWSEALRNSDNLQGDLKRRSVTAILKGFFKIYQIGLVFSSEIAKRPYFVWHGFVFINKVDFGGEQDQRLRSLMVAEALHGTFISKAAEQIGSKKLGEVFKLLASRADFQGGYIDLMNFACLLRAKPKNWETTASRAISKMDRKAVDLRAMLGITFEQFYSEVNTGGERELLKRLIATIRIKRDLKKENPGIKDLTRVVDQLEKRDYFEKPANRLEITQAPESKVD